MFSETDESNVVQSYNVLPQHEMGKGSTFLEAIRSRRELLSDIRSTLWNSDGAFARNGVLDGSDITAPILTNDCNLGWSLVLGILIEKVQSEGLVKDPNTCRNLLGLVTLPGDRQPGDASLASSSRLRSSQSARSESKVTMIRVRDLSICAFVWT